MIEVSDRGGAENQRPTATALPVDATDLFPPERELRHHGGLVRAWLLTLDTVALALSRPTLKHTYAPHMQAAAGSHAPARTARSSANIRLPPTHAMTAAASIKRSARHHSGETLA